MYVRFLSSVGLCILVPCCESNRAYELRTDCTFTFASFLSFVSPAQSQEQYTRATSEEMIVLALQEAKLLTVERPIKGSRQHDDAVETNSTTRHARSFASSTICPADCDGKATSRSEQGGELKKCPCDSSLSGRKCDGKCNLNTSTPALFKVHRVLLVFYMIIFKGWRVFQLVPFKSQNIKLVFAGPLLMSKETVKFNASADHEAELFLQGNLLPSDDSHMFNLHSEQLRLWKSDESRYAAHVARSASNVTNRLGRCAVVGNSGALLNYKQGRDVDLHDVVYRFNQVYYMYMDSPHSSFQDCTLTFSAFGMLNTGSRGLLSNARGVQNVSRISEQCVGEVVDGFQEAFRVETKLELAKGGHDKRTF